MSTAVREGPSRVSDVESRVNAYDWPGIAEHLDGNGWAIVKNLLEAS